MNNTFLNQMAQVGWNLSRYILASVTVMFATVSLMTGQFPPPVFEVAKSIQEIRSAVDLSHAAASISAARAERERQLAGIGAGDRDLASTNDGEANIAQSSSQDEKIKSLEYEIALLKSKLYRAEWEAEHFKEQLSSMKK